MIKIVILSLLLRNLTIFSKSHLVILMDIFWIKFSLSQVWWEKFQTSWCTNGGELWGASTTHGTTQISLELAVGRFHKSGQTNLARMSIPLDTESKRSLTGHTAPRILSHTMVFKYRKGKMFFPSWETSKKILLPSFLQQKVDW